MADISPLTCDVDFLLFFKKKIASLPVAEKNKIRCLFVYGIRICTVFGTTELAGFLLYLSHNGQFVPLDRVNITLSQDLGI